ncbi:MAG: ribosome maturation factor RimP [Candidatus Hydrogenedentes bacterium]|nr:ribosome maturation factor RimP [Candidatus Hydrogenedentota bacterium]
MVSKEDVIRRAWGELEPHLREQGFELVEVEFGQHGHLWILRLFLDKEGGITLDDCAAVSQVLNPVLDSINLIDGAYTLEVSSPGFDRPVRKPEDFDRFAGERIKIRTHLPVEGRKKFTGTLTGIAGDLVSVDCDGTVYSICIDNIQRANLDR